MAEVPALVSALTTQCAHPGAHSGCAPRKPSRRDISRLLDTFPSCSALALPFADTTSTRVVESAPHHRRL